jgi:hypothetical protein
LIQRKNIKLRKDIAVVIYMSAPSQLKRSSYLLTFSSGTSEQFLDWMFSFFVASVELMKVLSCACGHSHLKEFELSDLTT